ncbi:MAG: hypothetical protein JJT78_04725 [Leptospira sp.]|nr:hypothetical protein [Leptospira sp.]
MNPQKKYFSKSLFGLSFLIFLFTLTTNGLLSQKKKSIKIETVLLSYKKKFENESNSASHKKISNHKGEVVSFYHGLGMTAYTHLYPVQDSKGALFVFAYSANCPINESCDLGIENIKVYDSKWTDVTKRVLPLKQIYNATDKAKKRPDYNQPDDLIDTVILDIPEDSSGEFTFALVNGKKYDPTQGNSIFEVTHCRWNPKNRKCEIFKKQYELSP